MHYSGQGQGPGGPGKPVENLNTRNNIKQVIQSMSPHPNKKRLRR